MNIEDLKVYPKHFQSNSIRQAFIRFNLRTCRIIKRFIRCHIQGGRCFQDAKYR